MRTWFWSVVSITLAVLLALVIHRYPGNVLIVVDQWRVQVSLAFAILLVLGSFVGLYVILRVVVWLSELPDRYRGWQHVRHEKREQSMLEQGWTALLEGRYAHAEKMLVRLSGQSGDARRQVLALLSAARAAHEVGEFGRQDDMLGQAQKVAAGQSADVDLNTAVAATAADLWLGQGRTAEALGALQVDNVQPMRHLHTMRLMLRIHQQLKQHEKVLELARVLRRKQALSVEDANAMIESAAAALIRATASSSKNESSSAAFESCWKGLKSEERLLPDVALAGAQAFQSAGSYKEATKVLEAAIEQSFDPRLLNAYAKAEPEQVTPRLQKAEKWLEQRKGSQRSESQSSDADLLTTLGCLCLAAQMWGQAQRYLEQSAKLRKDARVHALLGSLFDRIGQPQQAAKHWRLATAVSAALPVLAKDVVLPPADVQADPIIPHVDELGAYGNEDDIAQSGSDATDKSVDDELGRIEGKIVDADYEEFFDSAPVNLEHYADTPVDAQEQKKA